MEGLNRKGGDAEEGRYADHTTRLKIGRRQDHMIKGLRLYLR